MASVIYVRVPDSLKQGLKKYAEKHEMTQKAALVSLLGRGLAVHQLAPASPAPARDVDTTTAALLEADERGRCACAHVFKAVARRARQPLANCKRCRHLLSGADFFTAGSCPNCGLQITGLLTPTRGGLDSNEYIAFIGALGALVSMAIDVTDETAKSP